MLRANDLPVDFEPSHPKLGHLVSETGGAARASCSTASARQRGNRASRVQSPRPQPQAARRPPGTTARSCAPAAASRRPTRPIWLMRQAGRYMPEYRAVREKTTFLELCKNPQLCQRGDVHRRRAAGRRRGDHLLRPAADPRTDGPGAGVRRRRGAGDSQPGARVGRRRPRDRAGKHRRRCTSCSRRSPKRAAICRRTFR